MMEIKITGVIDNTIENYLSNVTDKLKKLGYYGEISVNLEKSPLDNSLFGRWERYCVISYDNGPELYITEWSPNNNSEVSKIMNRNAFVKKLINCWYDNFDKYSEEDMISNLYDY